MKTRARLVLLALALSVIPPSAAVATPRPTPARGVAVVRAATAPYHSLDRAQRDGYTILFDTAGKACIEEPNVGGMGVHFVKGALVGDSVIRPRQPEAVIYRLDKNGKLVLAAAEYVVIQGAWDAEHRKPPALFGHEFMLTGAPNRFGLPPYYSLHVWAWYHNPGGAFEMWNPRVDCG